MSNLRLLPRAKRPPAPKPPVVEPSLPEGDTAVLILALLLSRTTDDACNMLNTMKLSLSGSPRLAAALRIRSELKNCENSNGRLKVISRYTKNSSQLMGMMSQRQRIESMINNKNPMNMLLGNMPQLKSMMQLMQGLNGSGQSIQSIMNLLSR